MVPISSGTEMQKRRYFLKDSLNYKWSLFPVPFIMEINGVCLCARDFAGSCDVMV